MHLKPGETVLIRQIKAMRSLKTSIGKRIVALYLKLAVKQIVLRENINYRKGGTVCF